MKKIIIIIIFCFSNAFAQSNTESPFGFTPADIITPGYADIGFSDAQNIGVKWHRPRFFAYWFIIQPDLETDKYVFNGSIVDYDKQYGSVPSGINIIANIAHDLENKNGRMKPGTYLPVNNTQYVNFVKATVERYDGDGVDDMPGLTNPIKYWQVDNEPNLNSVYTDFDRYQRMTFGAIKEACADCKVIVGGSSFNPLTQYIELFTERYTPILEALRGDAIDIMDIHMFGNASGDYRRIEQIYNLIRSMLDKNNFEDVPIWSTEMGSYSGDPDGGLPWLFQSEQVQARDIFKRIIFSLSLGIKKVFPAFGLIEGFGGDVGDNSYFDNTGLIYNGIGPYDKELGVKKLSYFTYKLLTLNLEYYSLGSIETLTTKKNTIFLCKFMKNGKYVYIAWYDYYFDPEYFEGGSAQITLNNLYASEVKVTDAVPTELNFNAFKTQILKTTNHSVTIPLFKNPVYIELIPPLLPSENIRIIQN